jgi:diguanylate cyclase
MKIDLSATGWGRVVVLTVAGTLFCVAAALFVDSFNFENLSEAALRRAILVNTLLPTFLAGPFLFFLLYKLRQLAIAHRQLQIIASTDSLTAVLNRGAFTMLVDAYLQKAGQQRDLAAGAMLMIDADHFKSINDKFGHDHGDAALKTIARAIQGELRGADIVGRIGGEEFGVFLPGAGQSDALAVAERIRKSIAEAEFSPAGKAWPLSVSVGGAVFDTTTTYDTLFVAADECLYTAKANGRNQVMLKLLDERGLEAAARR